MLVRFEGAESCVAVWLNGHYVGFAADSFSPAEFELTPYLAEGENKLACRVYRWNIGSWLEDQDFFRFSGLFRSVSLVCIPKAHVWDIRIQTLLDDAYTDATMVLDTSLLLGQGAEGATLHAALMVGKPYSRRRRAVAKRNTSSLPSASHSFGAANLPGCTTFS